MKFLGFALMELVKATGESTDVRTARTYDVVVYDKFGKIHHSNMKLGDIEREWGRFRRNGDRYGIMEGSTVSVISKEDFDARLAQWKTLRDKAAA